MEADLIQTLHTQYQLLDRLQVRWLYCARAPQTVAGEFHREYGTYAREWDQWLLIAEEIQLMVEESMEHLTTDSDVVYQQLELTDDHDASTAALKEPIPSVTRYLAQLALIDAEITAHREIKSQILYAEMLDTLE